MLKGFKDFLFRGSIVDLAVAVVIGTAFVALVTAFTTFVINPIIAAAGGEGAIGLGFSIRADNPATFVDIGAFITACLAFVITAAVVYLAVVVPMKKVTERVATPVESPSIAPDVQLLTEIRDLLQAERGATAPTSKPAAPAPPLN